MDTSLLNQQHQQVATAGANNKDKDRQGQQDHYGIFAIPDAIVRDVGPYKNLVRFTSSTSLMMELRGEEGFSTTTSPLLTKLSHMLEALQQVDARSSLTSHQQKLAFWLNVYNACIMHVRTYYILYVLPYCARALRLKLIK